MTWQLKGAGNANLVFSCQGKDSDLAGLVLRVRKVPTWIPAIGEENGTRQQPIADPAVWLDQALWEDILTKTDDKIAREEQYAVQYLGQWINTKYIPQGVACEMPGGMKDMVAHYQDVLCCNTPPLLFMDHTVFADAPPAGWKAVGPTLCAEIKPKAGCLAPTGYLSQDTMAIKTTYPRFVMHTLLKAAQGKGELSAYNPVDLFSQDEGRVQTALVNLLVTPNNNMRLFLAGKQMWGDSAHAKAKSKPGHHHHEDGEGKKEKKEKKLAKLEVDLEAQRAVRKARAQELGQLLQTLNFLPAGGNGGNGADGNSHSNTGLPVLVKALQEVLCREELLSQLLKVQQVDQLDIDGALPALTAISELYKQRMQANGDAMPHGTAENVWNGLNESQVMALLRGYLTSTTVKDCGIMVALEQVVPIEGHVPGTSGVNLESVAAASAEADNASDSLELAAAITKLTELSKAARGIVTVAVPGTDNSLHFRYKITLLDLDLKSATKIPSHAKLDNMIIECASQNMELLSQLVASAPAIRDEVLMA